MGGGGLNKMYYIRRLNLNYFNTLLLDNFKYKYIVSCNQKTNI